MALKLEITSPHKMVMGKDRIRVFGDKGGTIGRSLDNDWILPDQDRFISGRHATIDFQSGAWYLADVSTNGVYINGEEEPLGRRHPRRLFSGDSLRMGDFHFAVSINEGEDLSMPQSSPRRLEQDHLNLMVPEDTSRTGVQLLDEQEITGDDPFRAVLFGNHAKSTQKMVRKPSGSKTNGRAPLPPPSRPTPARLHTETAELSTEQLFAEFLNGLGVDRADFHPSADLGEIMLNAGQVMRELVSGMVELLISRANLKSTFKLDQTTLLPRHNNPLKLSENLEATLKQLLVGREGEYLGPLDSVREVCRDLKLHHEALADGMGTAILAFLEQLDPRELEESFDRQLNSRPFLGALNRMKYWQLYSELYPEITAPDTSGLPARLSDDFLRAYEKVLADYKRGGQKKDR